MATSIGSSLTLYSGVPLDNSYEHTYADTSYLSNATSANIYNANAYFIRADKNMVRISHSGMIAGGLNLYNCNYLSFINSTYNNKRFYCFVTDVRYINDNTAEIDFEVDVMMTWVATGLIEFEDCFIEREHTDTDNIGEHILEEPVDVGDYLYTSESKTNMSMVIVVGVAGIYFNGSWNEVSVVDYIDGVLCVETIVRYIFTENGTSTGTPASSPFNTVADLIRSLGDAGKTSWIKFVIYSPTSGGNYTVLRPNGLGINSAYIPKNKKLLTYPYICATVNNYEGIENDYAFELSSSTTSISFNCVTSAVDASASLIPLNYFKGSTNGIINKNKYAVLSGGTEEYSTYQAQLRNTAPFELTSNVAVPAATGALIGSTGYVGAAVGAGVGLITYIMKAFAGGEQAKLKGSTPTNTNSGMILFKNGTTQFGFYIKTIRPEYAKAIDSFFTKFGYKVNELKTPTKTCSRLSYKYVKTIGCALKGHAPATVVSKIVEIMDNGITFWSKSDIGNY